MTLATNLTSQLPAAASGRTNVVLVGHVDHGKSSILGRLLHDSGNASLDRVAALREQCERSGTVFEYAHLLDALKEERKQGITIDSARAVLRTEVGEFLFFDAPGHADFTGNLTTGATQAEACIVVVDAERGVQETLQRHSRILSLLAFERLVVAINKMDRVDWSESRFDALSREIAEVMQQAGLPPARAIPVSAMEGDNIVARSTRTPYYTGPTLLEAIHAFGDPTQEQLSEKPFRMEVQDVYKFGIPGEDRRIVAGTVATGALSVGDTITFYPSGAKSRVKTIERFPSPEQPINSAAEGEAIGLTLTNDIFVQRGDIACGPGEPIPFSACRLKALLIWLGREPLNVGDIVGLNVGTNDVRARVQGIEKLDKHGTEDSTGLCDREFAEVEFETFQEISFFGHAESRLSQMAVITQHRISGIGRIQEPARDVLQTYRDARRARESRWERSLVGAEARTQRMMQRPTLMVLTGGASEDRKTLAKILEAKLFAEGRHVYYLGFGSFLGGVEGRRGEGEPTEERTRRFGELAYVLLDSGAIVIATIGIFGETERALLRISAQPYDFVSVSLDDSSLGDLLLRPTLVINDRIHQLRQILVDRGAVTEMTVARRKEI